MAVKKIIHDAFEQVYESGKDMAKSSVKQVAQTLSPWDMIRNSFGSGEATAGNQGEKPKLNELQKKGGDSTPLDFQKLQKQYANQDQKNIESMKQRLFQLVKRDEEKMGNKKKQEKGEKERALAQEQAAEQRKKEEQRRQAMMSGVPEGKSGRGTALSKKKRKATEPQPAETKPGSSKQ